MWALRPIQEVAQMENVLMLKGFSVYMEVIRQALATYRR